MDIKEMSDSQLRGKLGYISKLCRNACDTECNGICPIASEEREFRAELSKRKKSYYAAVHDPCGIAAAR